MATQQPAPARATISREVLEDRWRMMMTQPEGTGVTMSRRALKAYKALHKIVVDGAHLDDGHAASGTGGAVDEVIEGALRVALLDQIESLGLAR